jgi:hypothetical protein
MTTDSSIVTGTATGDSGRFELQNLKAGDYLLRISYIGFENAFRSVRVPSQSDLGKTLLHESTNRLNEVVVAARRPFVEQRTDRYIVNVGSHILAAGRNALDVLGNTPGVLVTPEGDISVAGGSVNIYIDGRPSNLSGGQLRALLQSTQGETIDRIEVITNPSARYDASGGSIVNIRTKKGLQHGLNGSANAGYRQGRADRENAGLNLNYRYGQWNIFGNYAVERLSGHMRLSQMNVLESNGARHTFEQDAERTSIRANYGQQYKVGADFFIDKRHTVGALLSGYRTGDAETRILSATAITPSLDNVSRTTSDSRASEGNDGLQVNVNYQGILSESGRQLNIDMDYGQFGSISAQQSANEYLDTENNRIGAVEQLRHRNPPEIELLSAKADYTHPLGKTAKLEFGGKTGRSRTDNSLLYEVFAGNGWITDAGRTNRFVYTEQIHAAYVNYSLTAGNLSVQAGLRGEYTLSEGEQKTTGEVNDSTYLNLFPTLNVSYRSGKDHQFAFGYGRRIRRPLYAQLNPFETVIDAYSFSAGNPYLKPVITDNISLSYMNRNGLMARLSYGITNHMIENMPVRENNRYGMRLENFENKKMLSLMLNYRRAVTGFWTFNLTAEGAHVRNTSNETYGSFENSGFMLQAQLYNRFSITRTLSGELTGMYVSSQKQAYFYVKPMSNVSVGVSQSLLKNKLSVSLTANDLFYGFKADMTANNRDMDYRMAIRRDTRWVNIGIRYSFGSDKVKASRKRTAGIDEEAARVK